MKVFLAVVALGVAVTGLLVYTKGHRVAGFCLAGIGAITSLVVLFSDS